jgi:hypothetical protein
LGVIGVFGLVAAAFTSWELALFTPGCAFLAVQYARAQIVTSERGISYRGIFRWWHLEWDRVVGFETTTLRGEGGATDHPVAIVRPKSGNGARSRRRMFAIGAKSNDESNEIDDIVRALNALAAQYHARRT